MDFNNGMGIDKISLEGIALINDEQLKEELSNLYANQEIKNIASMATEVFFKLTSYEWDTETLCHFIGAWRSTHGTSLYVSGLMIRLLRLAKSNGVSKNLMFKAASEVAEIIPEDTGVDDIPHHERFAFFADNVCKDSKWRLPHYGSHQAEKFRRYVQHQRLHGDIQEAILTTAASENWNTGEFSFFATRVEAWLVEIIRIDQSLVVDTAAYVTVHSGETEKSHFLHAIKAWAFYCEAFGITADPKLAKAIFQKYILELAPVYSEMLTILKMPKFKSLVL